MQRHVDFVTTRGGAAVSGASVLVKTYPGGATATIYSDDGVTETTNPLTTDANGQFSFYAEDGRYTLVISKTGVITQQTLTDSVLLADPDDGTTEQSAADVSFAQSGSDAFQQTMQDKARLHVNAKDYKNTDETQVKPGAQDNASGIQRAINALTTGGRLDITAPGTYLVGTGLTVTVDGVYIYLGPGVILKAKDAAGITIVKFTSVSGGGIFGEGTIDGNKANLGTNSTWAVLCETSDNMVFRGFEIKNSYFSGLRLTTCSYCDVDGVYSHDHGGTGTSYGVVLYGCDHVTTRNCRIHDCDAYGYGVVENASSVAALYNTVSDCIIENCGIGGINIDANCNYHTVADNIITNCGDGDTTNAAGILWQATSEFGTISGNIIFNTNGHGIKAGGQGVSITGNIVRQSTFNGIYINAMLDGTCTGNTCLDNSATSTSWGGGRADGIRINDSFRVTVTGNHCGDRRGTPVQGYGIREMGTSDSNSIGDNTFANNVTGEVLYSGAATSNPQNLSNISVGSLTIESGVATEVVSDTRVRSTSKIFFVGTGAASCAVIGSSQNLYVSSITPATSFTVSTGDGTNVGSAVTFLYFLVN